MGGHKLRKGDEEGYLERYATSDGGKPASVRIGRSIDWPGDTYVQCTFLDRTNSAKKVAKQSRFEMSVTMTRNLTNSLEVHALSRYLPP
jgi:hypothetical protein